MTHFTKKPKLCLAVNAEHKADEIEYLVQSLELVLMHKEEDKESAPQN